METLTALARGVQPRALTEGGLVAAFHQIAGSSPVPVVVTADGEGRLDPTVEGALYFCGLEAIQNAVKHAAATSVRVDLQLRTGERSMARLAVSDDGTGIGPGVDAGSGLANMRERLESLGGSLHIDSRPGTGTRVVAVSPAFLAAVVGT
jgi:signal transduction histidine kinase